MTVGGLLTFKFPSKEEITDYIKGHPKTFKSEIDQKFVDCVSQFFANKTVFINEISGHVVLQIYALNDKLKLPSKGLPTVVLNLSDVLIACAKGEKIELKKIPAECAIRKKTL